MSSTSQSRREFIRSAGVMAFAGASLPYFLMSCQSKSEKSSENNSVMTPFFQISLAEWSLHKALRAGEFSNLDFPAKAKTEFGIDAVEYVNQFFADKAKDSAYLTELKKRCDDNGVSSLLIMCDNEGELASLIEKDRSLAVENHFKWVDAAKFLGCHSIRVNCFGTGSKEELAKSGAEGLRKLSEYAQPLGINVIVENHGGHTSDGVWLSNVIKSVDMTNCGTLPDFGNFCLRREKGDMWESPCVEYYDRYKGVEELLPFAKGVSAKTYDFDDKGNCVETDYVRMLKIVKNAGYTGRIGIEYEGSKLSEPDGIRATKKLLESAASQV